MLIHFLINLRIHDLQTFNNLLFVACTIHTIMNKNLFISHSISLNLLTAGLLCGSSVSLSPPPEEEPLAITRMVTSSLSSIAALASHSALGVQDLPHPDTPQGCKEAFQK